MFKSKDEDVRSIHELAKSVKLMNLFLTKANSKDSIVTSIDVLLVSLEQCQYH